jgi:ribosome-associated toxin RatA of RatAB toxin-antitoxin module
MREIKRSALVAKSPARVFELVRDVKRYPEYVPGCVAAQVQRESPGQVQAQLTVKRGVLQTHFTTLNTLDPPHGIHMSLVEGPFKSLEGQWRFVPVGADGCRIELTLQFEFSNSLKAALFEPVLQDTAAALVKAFVQRAQQN